MRRSATSNSYTVYMHISPHGKVYIGITARSVSRRWHGGSAYRNNKHFYSAIQKHGWENFRHEIIAEGLTFEDAGTLEKELIAKYNSTNPERGYNISSGGEKTTLGYSFSAESKQKISNSLKGKRKGIPHSAEHTENIRKALIGHKTSEETREKLRASLGERFNTAAAKEKQKQNTPKGSKHHRATKVCCIDTGVLFDTIEEAASYAGCCRSNISACCRGLQKSAGGMHWKYVEEHPSNSKK